MYTDSHAHISGNELFPHFKELLDRAQKASITKIINIATDKESLDKGLLISRSCPWVYNTAATTPHDVVTEGESFFPLVEEAASRNLLVGIGETGLDYHYEHSPKDIQKKYLIKYFELAKKYSLPLVIHCREAFADLFALADSEYKEAPAVLHCFTGTSEEAKGVIKRGWHISFSGIITFKKSESLRQVVREVPLDRILIETDAPYLAPQGKRGCVNESAFIVETAQMIAQIKGVNVEIVAKETSLNASRLFPFSKLNSQKP